MKEFIEQLIAHLETQKGWCSSRTCGAVTDEIRKFAEEYKPRTNADRIRSMTDEELVQILVYCAHCTTDTEPCKHSDDDVTCEQCGREWLESEVKE